MSTGAQQQVHLVSLGCPKNTVDSERMAGLLESHSYEMTADPEQADVIVVNTCGFIEIAKEESIEAVMAAHRLKREGKCRGVIVTGCLATRYHEELANELCEADQLLTIEEERDIVRHVDGLLDQKRARYLTGAPRSSLTPPHWAYLRISDGCDHHCAFCAIPAIRGRHKSESIEFLTAEAERLARQGVRELVLVSQDSVRYGVDLYGRPQLVGLMREISGVAGIDWIRLMYTYPAFWTNEMMDFFASCDKVCAYIDMPLQHIADSVLNRMKRATTRLKTMELLRCLRERLPGVGIRSSFIVGFPGETEQEFSELLDFVETIKFDYVTGFIYSSEEGTAAYDLDLQVPQSVKEERYSRLSQLQERISSEVNDALVGTRQVVLIDEVDTDGKGVGRMARDAPEIDGQVRVDGKASPGAFVEVEITDSSAFELWARPVGRAY